MRVERFDPKGAVIGEWVLAVIEFEVPMPVLGGRPDATTWTTVQRHRHRNANTQFERSSVMVTKGLLVRLEAKPGHEPEVEKFLEGVMPVIEQEPATIALFTVRLGPSTFGIFNAFPDEAGRQAHIGGDAAVGLSALAAKALSAPPSIEAVEILGAKLPEGRPAAAVS